MKTTAIELNPQVVAACRLWFKLPADDSRLSVVLGDAAEVAAHAHWRGTVDALQVDLYDHEAAAPVLDSEAFYADCRRLLTEDGCMTVNLFGRSSSFSQSLEKIVAAFGPGPSGRSARRARATPSCWPCARRSTPPAPRLPSAPKPSKLAGACRPASGCGSSNPPTEPAMTAVAKPKHPARGSHEGPLDWRRLVEWLSQDGVISAEEARRTIARCSQAESAQHPLVRLAAVAMERAGDGKPLDIESLTQWLAGRAGLDYLRIDPLKVDVGKVADTMSAGYAERHRVLPVQVTATEVVVATAEPFLTDWVDEVERQSRRTVRRVLASPLDIHRYTAEFFALAKSVRAAQKAGGNAGAASFEQLVELGKSNKQLDANDQGVVQVVDWLWTYAFDQRASDIHLEPRREQGVIRFRIDGVLHPVYQMPMGVLNAMTARIKLLGRMDVVEKRRPQDGRIKTRNPRGDEIEMRLSTLPTAFGEKMVMRIFDPDTAVKDLDALGFSQHDAQRWEALVKRPYGIILVTGPTGSGKTTTLVFHAQAHRHRRGEREHGGGPDRDDRAVVQPDPGAAAAGLRLRRRACAR